MAGTHDAGDILVHEGVIRERQIDLPHCYIRHAGSCRDPEPHRERGKELDHAAALDIAIALHADEDERQRYEHHEVAEPFGAEEAVVAAEHDPGEHRRDDDEAGQQSIGECVFHVTTFGLGALRHHHPDG